MPAGTEIRDFEVSEWNMNKLEFLAVDHCRNTAHDCFVQGSVNIYALRMTLQALREMFRVIQPHVNAEVAKTVLNDFADLKARVKNEIDYTKQLRAEGGNEALDAYSPDESIIDDVDKLFDNIYYLKKIHGFGAHVSTHQKSENVYATALANRGGKDARGGEQSSEQAGGQPAEGSGLV